MWSQVGSCPHCGAPIYVPTVYHSVIPPPNHFTCNCVSRPVTMTTPNTNPYHVTIMPCQNVEMRYGKNTII